MCWQQQVAQARGRSAQQRQQRDDHRKQPDRAQGDRERDFEQRGASASAEIRMTCAGAAHTSTVDIASHQDDRPKSWASAPMPI